MLELNMEPRAVAREIGSRYSVTRHRYGWMVDKPFPIGDFSKIAALCSSDGLMHSGIAAYYGAVLAIGEPDDIALWEQEIEASVATFTPPEHRFVSGCRHGLSSLTIVEALTQDESVRRRVHHGIYRSEFQCAWPHDSGDFGRCAVLLSLRPDWVARLPELGGKWPQTPWTKLAAAWGELAALHAAKDDVALTRRLQELTQMPPPQQPPPFAGDKEEE